MSGDPATGFQWDELDHQLPNPLCVAIGRMALSFAAMEFAVSNFLIDTGASAQELDELSKRPLKWKLDGVAKVFTEKQMLCHLPFVERLRVLAQGRNDIFHGLVVTQLWTPKMQKFHVWNPAWNRARSVTLDDLNEMTKSLRLAANELMFLAFDVKTAP